MSVLERLYLDYLHKTFGQEIGYIMNVKPGAIVLRNSYDVNLFEHEHVICWHNFLVNVFDPKLIEKPCALIIPCSRIKPYRLSPIHKIIDSQIRLMDADSIIQVYVLSEPMLLVPRELDIYYPFANYDYPIHELNEGYRIKFATMLSKILPKLICHKYIAAILPHHHRRILVKAIDLCNNCVNVEIFEYGKKAFHNVKIVTSKIVKKCQQICSTSY
jgi:predicted RNA-binding protein